MPNPPPDPHQDHGKDTLRNQGHARSHGAGYFEVEIKLRPVDLDATMQRVRELGFVVLQPRAFERNILLDTVDSRLRKQGEILRLREFGAAAVLTFKGASVEGGKHKRREEIETGVASASATSALLGRLGFSGTFRYEKFRTVYAQSGDPGLLTMDETPIGPFLELEGPPEWIDEVAAKLGFQQADYITDSYGQLWVRHCSENKVPLADFVFPGEVT
jgi:adenylate cyclase, class 2